MKYAILTLVAMLPVLRGEVVASDPLRIELGPPQVVLEDKALNLRYFPDETLAVVRTVPDCRVLVAAGVNSFLLEGPAMGTFTKSTKILAKGNPGEFDNGYAGIAAAVRARTGELLAFYHAEDQEQMQTIGGGIPGFYCRVALAVSTDDGLTFQKRGPILSGQLLKNPAGRPDQGIGEPWVLTDPAGQFLYAYYTSHERVEDRRVDICMARCPLADAPNPQAWKKFHNDDFTEPGPGGKDTPILTSARPDAGVLFPHVVHLPSLRQYMMTYCLNAWRDPEHRGFYVAFSDDGIHWPRERIQQIWRIPVIASLGQEVAWHPTFIPDEPAGLRGWLYYGYSENWGHKPPAKPHYLMRRRSLVIRPAD